MQKKNLSPTSSFHFLITVNYSKINKKNAFHSSFFSQIKKKKIVNYNFLLSKAHTWEEKWKKRFYYSYSRNSYKSSGKEEKKKVYARSHLTHINPRQTTHPLLSLVLWCTYPKLFKTDALALTHTRIEKSHVSAKPLQLRNNKNGI